MLSRLQKISKKLALIASLWVLFIAVHGIFVHQHQEINADLHACVLCEIVCTDAAFPPVEIPEPFVEFVQVFYSEIPHKLSYKTLFLYQTRGPPFAFLH